MRTIITTVGTSILKDLREPYPDPAEIYRSRKSLPHDQISAETNVFSRLDLVDSDRVALLHTDTDEGLLSAKTLALWLRDQRVETSFHCIEGLAYHGGMRASIGLRNFCKTAIQLANEARRTGRDIAFNANGGFKVLVGAAVSLGMVLDCPVYLIHDRFSEIVTLPALPISWDMGFLIAHQDLLEALVDGMPAPEFERRLNALPEHKARLQALATELDGQATLHDLAYAAYERLLDRDTSRDRSIMGSKRALDSWKKLRQTSLEKKFQRLIGQAADPSSSTWCETKNSAKDIWFLPKGSISEHIGFYEVGDQIVIVGLWTDHTDYIQAVDSGHLSPSKCPPAAVWPQ